MEHENQAHHEHHKTHNKKKSVTEKLRTNPWIMSTFVLGILAIILIVGSVSGGIGTKTISEDKAADLVLGFVESQVGSEAELVDVSLENGLYQVTVLFQGSEVPLYVTKDGKNLVQGVLPLSLLNEVPQEPRLEPEPTISTYSEEDKANLLEFSECLADKGVKAYGAGWCGYCKKLKETFGGVAQMEPFYLECQNADKTPTEHADLCAQEEIRGFPTIKINGEASGLSALSSLEEFAETTGCPLPQLSN